MSLKIKDDEEIKFFILLTCRWIVLQASYSDFRDYFVDAVLYHALLFISHCLFKKFTSIPWHSTINSFVIQTKTKITDHPAIIDIKRLHKGCHITLFSGIGCKTYIYNNNKFPNDFQFPLLPPLFNIAVLLTKLLTDANAVKLYL